MRMIRCPRCGQVAVLEALECTDCGLAIGLHPPSLRMAEATTAGFEKDGRTWVPCSNRVWRCNWLVADDAGTAQPTAAAGGLVLQASRVDGLVAEDVVPRSSYQDRPMSEMLSDWHWLSLLFNRVNHAMGKADLYPFTLTEPVQRKLDFVHRVVQDAAGRSTRESILT